MLATLREVEGRRHVSASARCDGIAPGHSMSAPAMGQLRENRKKWSPTCRWGAPAGRRHRMAEECREPVDRAYSRSYTATELAASPCAPLGVCVTVRVLLSVETTTFDVMVRFPPSFQTFS
jgi:hypothetical protein